MTTNKDVVTEDVAITQKKTFKTWYANNREKLSALRKEKYRLNPEIREKAKKGARIRRQEVPRVSTAGQPLIKTVNGVTQQVVRIGQASEAVGRKEQVLRIWERKKWVPKPAGESVHRYYTMHQITLLREFAQLIDQVRYQPAIRSMVISTKSAEVWARWNEG